MVVRLTELFESVGSRSFQAAQPRLKRPESTSPPDIATQPSLNEFFPSDLILTDDASPFAFLAAFVAAVVEETPSNRELCLECLE